MDPAELDARIDAAVQRYRTAPPGERVALVDQDAPQLVAELWRLDENARKERVHQLIRRLVAWQAIHIQRKEIEKPSKN